MAAPDLIDLRHQAERVVGVLPARDRRRARAPRLRAATCIAALKAGARRARARAHRRPPPAALAHPPRPRRRRRHARPRAPRAAVHVSEIGAPHVVDPSRLEASARRLYGDAFDPLWGELAPVPEENVHVVGDRVLGLECFPSPGHASHHVCYLHADGTLYAGDAAGVRIQPGRYVLPVSPAAGRRRRGLVPDVRGDRAPPARAARADPLRRRRRRRPSTSRSSASRARRGGRARPRGPRRRRRGSRRPAGRSSPRSARTRPTTGSGPPRSGSPTSG